MKKLFAPEVFFDRLRAGVSVTAAAGLCGVSPDTGYRWLAEAGGPVGIGLPPRKTAGRPWGGRKPAQVRDVFWAGLVRGITVRAAAKAAGVSEHTGHKWLAEAGGVKPEVVIPELEATLKSGTGPLCWVDRCRIEELIRAGYTPARIARLLGRPRSTITRELERGQTGSRGRYRYRAVTAQNLIAERRRRPGRAQKLVPDTRLHAEVLGRLKKRHSPEQIAGRLRLDFPDDPEMWVSHETIYQALYVQARGGLADQVKAALRTGRTRRKPQGRQARPKMRDMINISERPAEAVDRAVPGHWEGDLICGTANKSAIGTLVERTSGFVILLHLTEDHTAETVAAAMAPAMERLPEHLWRSLTWDQGSEMALHTKITTETGMPIYFCDPHSPWQRGTNENTNGLLRQYFPKGTDLSFYGPGLLDQVAAELNARPRERLDWKSPAEVLERLLSDPTNPVASIA